MNGSATAYDLGDNPARPRARGAYAIEPHTVERHAFCATCSEMVYLDTDGMGGLRQFDAATYRRHRHGITRRVA